MQAGDGWDGRASMLPDSLIYSGDSTRWDICLAHKYIKVHKNHGDIFGRYTQIWSPTEIASEPWWFSWSTCCLDLYYTAFFDYTSLRIILYMGVYISEVFSNTPSVCSVYASLVVGLCIATLMPEQHLHHKGLQGYLRPSAPFMVLPWIIYGFINLKMVSWGLRVWYTNIGEIWKRKVVFEIF